MIEANHVFESHFKGASMCQISMNGYIDINWFERLSGMKINHLESETGTFSTLTGLIIDQSELVCIFNSLNDYHCTILSVNKINL
ncbi:MAG: hypothetical protein KAQ62_27875 [Cyclobacteriaceae bacterium]|nr:hypothetical protein [Cyclobacteriaceae bacterium]